VAVSLIVEREREIINFKVKPGSGNRHFLYPGKEWEITELKAELSKTVFDQKRRSPMHFLEKCNTAEFNCRCCKKPAKRSPAQPFTTSTLQQEASRKLGFSVSQTMAVAQRFTKTVKLPTCVPIR
jgi:DNA topoisomerase I